MREVVVSAATLAGLVGLACLYSNDSQRVRRDAEFEAIGDDYDVMEDLGQDNDDLFQADYDFIKEFGLFEDNSDMPDVIKEDIAMFSDGAAIPGNQRNQIQFVQKCVNNHACKARAEAKVKEWGANVRKYCEQNWEAMVKPVTTSVIVDTQNKRWGVCTPEDVAALPCGDESANNSGKDVNINGEDKPQGEKSVNGGAYLGNSDNIAPWMMVSVNAAFTKKMDEASKTSDALVDSSDATGPSEDLTSSKNIFTNHGDNPVKIVFIMPNGIPISMSEQTKTDFSAYWNFFKVLNKRFIGVQRNKNNKAQLFQKGRDKVFFWFIRQDKAPKAIQKAPVMANAKFPWNRFEKLMSKPYNSAGQPNLKATYQLLAKKTNRLSSDMGRGSDCFVLWFHQYLPSDIIDLANVNTQENLLLPLGRKCNIIHFWVGMDSLDGDKNTVVVTKYLQGIMMPEQRENTVDDPDFRNWFYVPDIATLNNPQYANQLAFKVYNIWVLETFRVMCLLTTKPVDFVEFVKEANAAKEEESTYDYNYYYASTTSTAAPETEGASTAIPTTVGTTTTLEAKQEDYYGMEEEQLGMNTTTWSTEAPEAPEPIEENNACCGCGVGGHNYNTNTHQCCDGGVEEISYMGCA